MFGAFVARMEDNTRVPNEVNDVRRTGGGRGLRGGQKKKWMGCFLDDCSPGRGGNGAGRPKQGRNVLWRNESLQRKPWLDYGMQ